MEESNVTKITLKHRVNEKLKEVSKWTRDHTEELKIFVPVIIGVGTGVGKIIFAIVKSHQQKADREFKDLYVYDRSLGHYWKLSDALTSRDWKQINDRKKNGESLADILWDMGVLD